MGAMPPGLDNHSPSTVEKNNLSYKSAPNGVDKNNFTFFLPHNIHNVGYAKQLQTATGGITSR
jgi:hypothetical protein